MRVSFHVFRNTVIRFARVHFANDIAEHHVECVVVVVHRQIGRPYR